MGAARSSWAEVVGMSKLATFKNFLQGLGPVGKIQSECRAFLDETDQPLYRGVGATLNPFKMMSAWEVRKDRQPRDAHPLAHKVMDEWFEKNFGIKPRSEGLFCTSNIEQAKDYGSPCFVFPVGNFKYLWGVSATTQRPIKDTLELANRIAKRETERTAGPLIRDTEHAREIANDVLRSVKWSTSRLKEAQSAGAEITVICDHYYLVPVDSKDPEQYLKITRG